VLTRAQIELVGVIPTTALNAVIAKAPIDDVFATCAEDGIVAARGLGRRRTRLGRLASYDRAIRKLEKFDRFGPAQEMIPDPDRVGDAGDRRKKIVAAARERDVG